MDCIPGGRLSRIGVETDPSFGVVEDVGLAPAFPRSFSSSVVLHNQQLTMCRTLLCFLPSFSNWHITRGSISLSRDWSNHSSIGKSTRNILKFTHNTNFILSITKHTSLFPSFTRVTRTTKWISFIIPGSSSISLWGRWNSC
jgi:hypothetical protein